MGERHRDPRSARLRELAWGTAPDSDGPAAASSHAWATDPAAPAGRFDLDESSESSEPFEPRGSWLSADWDARSLIVAALVIACAALAGWAWVQGGRPASAVSRGDPPAAGITVESSGMPVGAGGPGDAAAAGAVGSTASARPPDAAGTTSGQVVSGGAGGEGSLTVHVVGKVRRPGLYRLPLGARVADAIEAAGGVTRPRLLQWVNQARAVADGEQVRISRAASPAATGTLETGGSSGAGAGAQGPAVSPTVNLNTATAAQLDALPRVGPVTAERILTWRAQNGPFRSVDQLQEVPGIGDATFAGLREMVSVS